MSANWKNLAIAEAQIQGVDANIVLATVDAETSGTNIPGDYRDGQYQALGFGQVWPKWHTDAFTYAANRSQVNWPSTLSEQNKLVLGNDALSMAAAVYVIKQIWNSSGKDFRKFSLSYVGPAIPDSDYNRRYNIWVGYQGGKPVTGNLYGGVSGTQAETNNQLNNQSSISIPATNYGVVSGSQQLGNVLYGRKYRVIVSNANGDALDVSQLRCTFKIQKTALQPPNFSEIIIYNLSPDTENAIIQEGNRIIVEAGYEGDQYGLIFDGDVIQPIRDKEDGVTYRLSLFSMDGDRFMNQGTVGFSVLKGQTSRSQVDNIMSQVSIPSQLGSISDGFHDAQLSRGKVFFGLARDYLRQIAQSQEATFYVNDGKVNIIKASDLPAGEILDLSPASGLIGVPTQSEYGITFRCLLNPRIKIDSFVHIDNSLIRAQQFQQGQQIIRNLDNDGIYRIISTTFIGDTRGDNWYTECTTVSQAGIIPGMISTVTANPY